MGYEFIDHSRITVIAYDMTIPDLATRKLKAI